MPIVSGYFDAEGIGTSNGYTVSKKGQGVYEIEFEKGIFSKKPVVVATPESEGIFLANVVTEPTDEEKQAICTINVFGVDKEKFDSAMNFIAIGS